MTSRTATRMALCLAALLACADAAAASPEAPQFARTPDGWARTVTSEVVDGARGGKVSAGRFTLCIPRGAWRGEATVSLRVPDPGTLECELSVVPAPDGFAVPLMLQTDIGGTLDVRPQYLKSVTAGDVGAEWSLTTSSIVSLPTHTLYTRVFGAAARYGVVEGTSGW